MHYVDTSVGTIPQMQNAVAPHLLRQLSIQQGNEGHIALELNNI